MSNEMQQVLKKFLIAFEQVFDNDWKYTKNQLGIKDEMSQQKNAINDEQEIIHIISPEGTFLNPKIDDETEDWGYRGELLAQYRKLKILLNEE